MQYLFILGNNPELSVAEILNVIEVKKILGQNREFLAVEAEKFDCQQIIRRLGGTIKIGLILGKSPENGPVLGVATSAEGKFKFGFSFYGQKPSNIGMKIKKLLKEQGISARLVTSREPALSAVIVKKEKCQDFLVVPGFFGLTCAVQDFEAFGKRDFGRPASDSLSGMLPPKVARMMINLSGVNGEHVLLDPFCGSGTILAEALDLEIKNLIGTDLSEKAIRDSRTNLAWLQKEFSITNLQIPNNFQLPISKIKNEAIIFEGNVKELSKKIKPGIVTAIVTEPYLGQPIRGNETDMTIKKIIRELEELYIYAFAEFKKVLVAGGRIVIIIPEWHLNKKVLRMNIFPRLEQMGWARLDDGDLIYKRENQKVWRNITVWEK